ncbi:MAG: hypothetical protein GC129_01765 [Proteobacteria bacterium]|nr:hypothetical protein [Pseudomonadota bacterium]
MKLLFAVFAFTLALATTAFAQTTPPAGASRSCTLKAPATTSQVEDVDMGAAAVAAIDRAAHLRGTAEEGPALREAERQVDALQYALADCVKAGTLTEWDARLRYAAIYGQYYVRVGRRETPAMPAGVFSVSAKTSAAQ